MKRALAAFVAVFALSAQSAPQQFDLVCTGTRQMAIDGPLTPITQRLRVDLQGMQYCFDACDHMLSIQQVMATRIIFSSSDEETPRRRMMASSEVDRVTGQYRNFRIETRPLPTFMETKGVCEAAPFSGFPRPRF